MQHDYQFWLPSKNVQFNLSSAWEHIRSKHTEVKWSTIIWGSKCAPKISICSLLAISNRLNTKDRVSRWNNNINRLCVLCSNHTEDRDHLFSKCSYSKQLLEEIMQKLRISLGNAYDFNQILETMYQINHSNKLHRHIINIAFTSLIWHIWCERNSRIFKGIEMPVIVRKMLITQDCRHLFQESVELKKRTTELIFILSNFDFKMEPSIDFHPP